MKEFFRTSDQKNKNIISTVMFITLKWVSRKSYRNRGSMALHSDPILFSLNKLTVLRNIGSILPEGRWAWTFFNKRANKRVSPTILMRRWVELKYTAILMHQAPDKSSYPSKNMIDQQLAGAAVSIWGHSFFDWF